MWVGWRNMHRRKKQIEHCVCVGVIVNACMNERGKKDIPYKRKANDLKTKERTHHKQTTTKTSSARGVLMSPLLFLPFLFLAARI
jgi:hypothetical protein